MQKTPTKMNNQKQSENRTRFFGRVAATALTVVATLATMGRCYSQGTLTFTFDVEPRGSQANVGTYTESGMYFGPIGPGNLLLSGGGIAGYPDNGTGYLEIPDGNMGCSFTQDFNLVSFDAAEFDSFGPQTLTVVGYRDDVMGLRVTNYFSISSLTFQTFYLDSSFAHVGGIDFLNARWSLDNLLVSGVPEPSASALTALGGLCWFARRRMLGRRAR
jgi:hypothetical protein